MGGSGFTVGSWPLAVGSLRLAVPWSWGGGSFVGRGRFFRGGTNGTQGTYDVRGANLTANCQPLNLLRVVESTVVNGETAASMFGVDLNKSAVP